MTMTKTRNFPIFYEVICVYSLNTYSDTYVTHTRRWRVRERAKERRCARLWRPHFEYNNPIHNLLTTIDTSMCGFMNFSNHHRVSISSFHSISNDISELKALTEGFSINKPIFAVAETYYDWLYISPRLHAIWQNRKMDTFLSLCPPSRVESVDLFFVICTFLYSLINSSICVQCSVFTLLFWRRSTFVWKWKHFHFTISTFFFVRFKKT